MADIPEDALGSLEDAARVAGVSPATLLKWRAQGEFGEGEFVQLKARRGRGHAYAIRLTAAVRVAADHWTPPRYVSRPATLPTLAPVPVTAQREERIAGMTVRRAKTTRNLRPSDIPALPEGWETVNAFAVRHGMKENWRSMWKDRLRQGKIRVHEGSWWSGNHVVHFALDRDGTLDFGTQFAMFSWWRACELAACPFCSSLTNRATNPYNEDARDTSGSDGRTAVEMRVTPVGNGHPTVT